MIETLPFACTSSALEPLTTTAAITRWPNAARQLPGAPPSAPPIPFTRVEQDDSTAAPIRSIQLDDLAVHQRHPTIHSARQLHVVSCDQHRDSRRLDELHHGTEYMI